ncbi:hypothetical protein [Marinomonas sp. PE14-40]|uniref:hypothetical protein n=1 Tax=Marinomonas sp. PE14-40 TaxID=3060621 RepID=UPI003F678B77
MWLTKYYLLVCLPEGICFYDLSLNNKQGYKSLADLLLLQQSLHLSMDEYLSQDVCLDLNKQERKLLTSPFCQVFLLVPDAWIRSIETLLPLTDSRQVKSLAALALASEVSHLAPERVCYRYRVNGQDDEWQLSVTTAPKGIYDFISEQLPKVSRFKGLIPQQDCQQLLLNHTMKHPHKQLASLSIKPSFKQTNFTASQYARRWVALLCLVFVSQLVLLFSFESEKQRLDKAAFHLEQTQYNSVTLAKVSPNQASIIAKKMMQILPLDIRINSISNEKNTSWLGISIDSEQLLTGFSSWQQKWKNVELTLMDEWQQPINLEDIEQKYPATRTRSVLNVVIQIQQR